MPKVKVLVIDDDPDLREMLHLLLSQADFDVVLAADGLGGLRLAQEQHPDVILLDVMMPGMDGHQVLHHLRNLPEVSAVPVIMLTALNTLRHVQSLVAHGARDYVIKPFEANVLIERVHRILSKAAADANAATEQDLSAGRERAEKLFVIAHAKCWQADVLARHMKSHGSLLITDSGSEALALVLNYQPQVLFAALELDGISGQELVQRLRQATATSSINIVGLSAEAGNPAEKRRLLEAGFDDVLRMPPSLSELKQVLERVSQPRASYAQVRDNVVVLAVVALDSEGAIRRLRDAIVDFLGAKFTRFIIDLSYADGANQAAATLQPFFQHIMEKGIGLRIVATDPAVRAGLLGGEVRPEVFASVEEAFTGWH
ncbi:MAG: response regulator [Anaerolineae bacterium]